MELLDSPMYAAVTAGRLASLNAARVRRWLRGYEFQYTVGSDGEVRRSYQSPVVTPLGAKGQVVVDPRIAFGQLSIMGQDITTANVYDLYLGENERIAQVCKWMKLSEKEANAAIFLNASLPPHEVLHS